MPSRTSHLPTVTQAAARLKTTRQNIYDAIDRGRLVAQKVGNAVLVFRQDLNHYAKSRKRTGRPKKTTK